MRDKMLEFMIDKFKEKQQEALDKYPLPKKEEKPTYADVLEKVSVSLKANEETLKAIKENTTPKQEIKEGIENESKEKA